MKNTDTIRKYGDPPYSIAVLHGGPGAPGYMVPVARELAKTTGVIEPLQTKDSLVGQMDELIEQLSAHADPPVTLIGSSWGVVLALFTAARKEIDIEKLILIGSAVFDAESSASIEGRRLDRLSEDDRQLYEELMKKMNTTLGAKRDMVMAQWGALLDKTDMYDPETTDLEVIEVQADIFSKVWPDFTSMRDKPGYLKTEFSKIDIPVIVIHGEYDPHPIEGIRPFLEGCLSDIHFHILKKCGHYPWIERQAREEFFDILRGELKGI